MSQSNNGDTPLCFLGAFGGSFFEENEKKNIKNKAIR